MNFYGRMLASGGLAVIVSLSAIAAHAQAQVYPTRSITMIVPFAAGGPTDVNSRIVAAHMAQTLARALSSRTWSAPAAPRLQLAPRVLPMTDIADLGAYGHPCGVRAALTPTLPIIRKKISSRSPFWPGHRS